MFYYFSAHPMEVLESAQKLGNRLKVNKIEDRTHNENLCTVFFYLITI